MSRERWRYVAAIAAVALGLGGCGGSGERPLRIGVIVDCQGAFRALRDVELSGAQLPLMTRGADRKGRGPSDGLTAAHVDGRPIELVRGCSESGELAALTQVARLLVERMDVDVVVEGGVFSVDGIALREVARRYPDVPFVAAADGPREVTLQGSPASLYRGRRRLRTGRRRTGELRLSRARVAAHRGSRGGLGVRLGRRDGLRARVLLARRPRRGAGPVGSRRPTERSRARAARRRRRGRAGVGHRGHARVPARAGAAHGRAGAATGARAGDHGRRRAAPGRRPEPTGGRRRLVRAAGRRIARRALLPARVRARQPRGAGRRGAEPAGDELPQRGRGGAAGVRARPRELSRNRHELRTALGRLRTRLLGVPVRMDVHRQAVVSTTLVRVGDPTAAQTVDGVDQSIGGLVPVDYVPSEAGQACRRAPPPRWAG
jgi:hypothetical protein